MVKVQETSNGQLTVTIPKSKADLLDWDGGTELDASAVPSEKMLNFREV